MNYFLYFLAIFFPPVVLLIKDNPGGFFVAMVLQASLIGWIPASIWAFNTIKADMPPPKPKKSKKKQAGEQQQEQQPQQQEEQE